jgi:chromate reductase
MSQIYKIVVFVGSLRRASLNLKLARAVVKQFPPEFTFEFASLGDIPLYNQDLDNAMPASAVKLKQQIVASDGILIVTPEHNRSLPAALKNAIDWGTRPPGQNSFDSKPSGIMGTSPSATGTGICQQHLRAILAAEGSPTFTRPEVFLQWKEGLIDDQDVITNETTREFLQGWVNGYVKWIKTLSV